MTARMMLYLGRGTPELMTSTANSVFGLDSVSGTERLKEAPSGFSLAKGFNWLEDDLCWRSLVELVEFPPGKDSEPTRLLMEIKPTICPSQRRMNWTLLNLLDRIMSLMPRYRPQTRNRVSTVPPLLGGWLVISTRGK